MITFRKTVENAHPDNEVNFNIFMEYGFKIV